MNTTRGTWIAVADRTQTDTTWTLYSFTYQSEITYGINQSIPIYEIGRTPEGYIISSQDFSSVSIIINETIDYTTGEWQITEYKFETGTGITDIMPVHDYALNHQEFYGGLSQTSNDTDGDGLWRPR